MGDNMISHNETFKFDETVKSFDSGTEKLRNSNINFEKDKIANFVGKKAQLAASIFNTKQQFIESDVLNVKDRKSQTPMPQNKMLKDKY